MTRRVLVALVVLGLAAAAVVLVGRVRLEARYRAVEIVLDGDDWLALARREGEDPLRLLRALRQAGATSVAVAEPTLRRLADDGRVAVASGASLQAVRWTSPLAGPFGRLADAGGVRPDTVYVTGEPDDLRFVAGRLTALLGPGRVAAGSGLVAIRGTFDDVVEMGLGYRPADVALPGAAGLDVVLRPRNHRALAPESLHVLIRSYGAVAPAPLVIFALTEIQGYEGLVADAAQGYRDIGARFGRIEVFAARRKQRGEDRFTELLAPSVVRVFSITPEELAVLSPVEVADRFVRAAQERNIRVLYVRPLLATPAGVVPLEVNRRLVETVAARLRAFGFQPARSRPLPPLQPAAPLSWLVAAGALALSLLVLTDLARAMALPAPAAVVWTVWGLGIAGAVAASLTRWADLLAQVLALGVAVAGAAGATVWALPAPAAGDPSPGASRRPPRGVPGIRPPRLRGSPRPERPRNLPAQVAAAGWLTLLRAVALAVTSGVFVAALLSRWSFMLAFSTFLGVKVAHVVPVVLVALWLGFAGRTTDWRTTARDLRAWLDRPLRLGAAVAVVAVGLLAAVLLVRTGNVGLPLASAEVQLRSTLEDLLVARPRTKEFLIGYPALVLAGTAMAVGWRRPGLVLAAVGTIGTAGAINSLSHLHTPLLYTLWRTGNALVLGAVLAVPPVLVLLWLRRRLDRS